MLVITPAIVAHPFVVANINMRNLRMSLTVSLKVAILLFRPGSRLSWGLTSRLLSPLWLHTRGLRTS